MQTTMAILTVLLHRLGRNESAATIGGCARSPFTTAAIPELDAAIINLRNVLGDQAYKSLDRKGETMSTADMVAYACDQIDQARRDLNAVSE
jgi:hypothetical protein